MESMDLVNPSVLHTERLLLRELTMADAPALFGIRQDTRVMRYIPRDKPHELAEVEALIEIMTADRAQHIGITWGITVRGSERIIGTIGFYRLRKEHRRGEVGYLLHRDEWGKGYASEALVAVVQHGFRAMGFHRIEAYTDPLNGASNRLLARQGFVCEAHLHEDVFWEGRYMDSLVWSRIALDTLPSVRVVP